MPLPNRSTASTYDAINKVNYNNVPPANQALDWDNTRLGPAIGDVAALGLTAPRFYCNFLVANTTGGLVLVSWQAVWKNVTTTTPTLARVGTGHYTVTLPSVVSDEYDASLGLTNNITLMLNGGATAAIGSATVFGFVNASVNGANGIDVYTANTSGTPTDFTLGTGIFVVAY